MDKTGAVIDHIYSAATDRDAWPRAVQSLQGLFASNSTGLYSVDARRQGVSIIDVRDIDPDYVRAYVDRYLHDNPWSPVPSYQRPGVIRTDRSLDDHYGQPGYYRSTGFFNEWMRPQDFIYSLGVNLLADERIQVKLYLYRSRQGGAFSRREIDRFQLLVGHLRNAATIAQRLALSESRALDSLHVIDRLTFGIAFLDEEGRLMHANRFAGTLFREHDGLCCRDGRITTLHRADDRQLTASVKAALAIHQGRGIDAPCPINARRKSPHARALSVLATPLPRRPDHPFAPRSAAVALIVSAPEQGPTIPSEWLRRRYGLTGTETRLVQCLVLDASLRIAADSAGLSYETARWYLKRIFQKTGASRQSDLVRRLLSEQVPILSD